VWKDTVLAVDEGDEASEWLSKFLETRVRLVRLLHDNQRRVPTKYEIQEDEKGESNKQPSIEHTIVALITKNNVSFD